jgi:hypothetical protein
MDLSRAFVIIVEEGLPNATLQEDHVCTERVIHTLKECILPRNRVYTLSDASLDTPDALRGRLRAGKAVKPT